jgi:acyl-CoA synthetase (NDP forming)
MLKNLHDIRTIVEAARPDGWVMEPDAKRIFSLAGLDVPRHAVARTAGEASSHARDIGYPVVAKIVSPKIVHKSDVKGVVVGIADEGRLLEVFRRFETLAGFAGMLVEEMASGVELIAGAMIDFQFGPMILLGMGGTGVEIYRDVSLRMAPITERDVPGMVADLRARRLLEGYRGAEPVDIDRLAAAVAAFSELVVALADDIESIDINPLMCSARRSVAADARIMLK